MPELSYFVPASNLENAIKFSVGVAGAVTEVARKARDLQVQVIESMGLVETGAFLRSIRYDVDVTEDGWTATVGSDDPDVEYARFLEFGTVHAPAFAPLRTALTLLELLPA